MELQSIINNSWKSVSQKLHDRIKHTLGSVEELVALYEIEQKSTQVQQLQSTLGSFAGSQIDFESMSSVISKKQVNNTRSPESITRLKQTLKQLQHWHTQFGSKVPAPLVIPHKQVESDILIASKHLNILAECFKLLRISWLELNSKYDPTYHDTFFENFSWEQLNNDEVSLCPPCVIHLQTDSKRNVFFTSILPLLTSGLPIKIVLASSDFTSNFVTKGRSSALRCSFEIETLPVSLNGVYVLQDSSSRPEVVDRVQQALQSPRPTLIHIFDTPDEERSAKAIQSRALPLFTYNPDASEILLKRFDLKGNPEQESLWPMTSIEYINSNGKKDRLDYKYTFADFAVTESMFQADFKSVLDTQKDRILLFSDYLELSTAQRSNKIPFVYSLKPDGTLEKKIPSLRIVAHASERKQFWNLLCEMSGVRNPYFQTLESQIKNQLKIEFDQSIQELKKQHIHEMQQAKQEAVKQAFENLAKKLINQSDLANIAQTPVISKPPTAPAPASVPVAASAPVVSSPPVVAKQSKEPWIDSRLCSGCDECITIDPKIFAYNSNKQAYIKDAKGGPYKNILKAAKMCSAKIIFAGEPS